ncbi:ATP synthase subunit epsilon, mitochondrial [Harpegnathos saltator]|uniref:ATP synthase subunit epsilon, mitochondrial n=1 Tax=Harpegnathos saltator TaxID=610380 RepID=E2BF16_HARSA|nr:ATP synthase subunit epsilon, mitochondrial [Harpegnathos saltator]
MSAWRQAGLNYINYSQIAARLVRQALKADLRAEAVKRDDANVKFTQWKDGKPISMYNLKFIIQSQC